MSRKQFDRFMVANDNGRNLKLARFTDGEFRALIQGILPIASEATPRGSFMVGGQAATADDVTFLAPKVSKRTAQRAIDRMRSLGMLEFDDEIGGEWIHDWDLLNPAPKTDRTNAERQRRFRERRNAESNAVTQGVTNADVTPPEVKKGKKEGEEASTAGARELPAFIADVLFQLRSVPQWERALDQGAELAVLSLIQAHPGVPWLDLTAEAVASRLDPSPGSLRTDSPVQALTLRLNDHRTGKRNSAPRPRGVDDETAARHAEEERILRGGAA